MMSAQLWRDVRRLRDFIEREREMRELSKGGSGSREYRRDAQLAENAFDRIVDRLRRTFP